MAANTKASQLRANEEEGLPFSQTDFPPLMPSVEESKSSINNNNKNSNDKTNEEKEKNDTSEMNGNFSDITCAENTPTSNTSITTDSVKNNIGKEGRKSHGFKTGPSQQNTTFANATSVSWIKYDRKKMEAFKSLHKACIVAPDTLRLPEEHINKKERVSITYKCINIKTKKVENPTPSQAEKCLKDVWSAIWHINKGKKYGTLLAICRSEEDAIRLSTIACQSDSYLLVPSYLGRRVTKVTVLDISPCTETEYVEMLLEEHGEIIQTHSTTHQNWSEIRLEVLMLLTPAAFLTVPDRIKLTDGEEMRIIVEGRRARCFTCGSTDHQRAFCPQTRRPKAPLLQTPRPQQQQHTQQQQQRKTQPKPTPTQRKSLIPPSTNNPPQEHPTPQNTTNTHTRINQSPLPSAADSPSMDEEQGETNSEWQVVHGGKKRKRNSASLHLKKNRKTSETPQNMQPNPTQPKQHQQQQKQTPQPQQQQKPTTPPQQEEDTPTQQPQKVERQKPQTNMQTIKNFVLVNRSNSELESLLEENKDIHSEGEGFEGIAFKPPPDKHLLRMPLDIYAQLKSGFPSDVGFAKITADKRLMEGLVGATQLVGKPGPPDQGK